MRLHAVSAFVFLCVAGLFSSEARSQDAVCASGNPGMRSSCLAKEIEALKRELAELKRLPGPQGEKGRKATGEKKERKGIPEKRETKEIRAIPGRKGKRGPKATKEIVGRKARKGIREQKERRETQV